MSASDDFIYRSEMGFSHSELLRGLNSAVEPYIVTRIDNTNYSLTHKDQTALLNLGPERIRQIASIKLPVTDIEIEFKNFSETEYMNFLERFKKYLHRGGG